MCKLNMETLNKLIDTKCSSIEINLLLYLCTIQSEFGQVRYLNYKDVCLKLNITKASFYKSLYNLEGKDIINIDWTNTWGYKNLSINGNIYNNKKSYKNSYINVNRYSRILFSDEFINGSANFKYLVLSLLRLQRESQHFKVSIEKIKNYAGVKSTTVALNYIDVLSKFFKFEVKHNIYTICVKNEFSMANKKTEKQLFLTYKIKSFCSAYKVSYSLKDIDDLLTLFNQYSKRKLRLLLYAITDTTMRYKRIEPKAINYICSQG